VTVVHVFDPAMCCSTGICGPSVDPQLVRFAADLDALKGSGVTVERFNLSQQPAAFVGDEDVKRALEEKGEAALPLIKVDGVLKSVGTYPERAELVAWAGLGAPASPSLYTDAVAELVAIGAAVASGCEPCFKFHFDKASKLGVSVDDMRRAVDTAKAVREAPARAVLELADRFLKAAPGPLAHAAASPATKAAGCCGPSASKADEPTVAAKASSGCCGPKASTTSASSTTTTNKTACC
jgi:AhpD family alkylhydroperoxidase